MTAISPWTAIEKRHSDHAAIAERERKEEVRKQVWNAVWRTAAQRLDAASLRALASHLQPEEFALWLDYRDVLLTRAGWIFDQHLLPGYERANSHYYQLATLQLLKYALLNKRQFLTMDLRAMTISKSQPAIADTLEDFRGGFKSWCEGHYPPTPFLSQTELAAALRCRLQGYGKSGISAKVDRGELVIQQKTVPASDGKTIYSTYLHRDSTVQREILEHVVTWMREKSPKGSSFSSGLWATAFVPQSP